MAKKISNSSKKARGLPVSIEYNPNAKVFIPRASIQEKACGPDASGKKIPDNN
tara:strand:+ start:177 stop:335 length:159 start_codon:yes stop_codon:yes gene_type:complete